MTLALDRPRASNADADSGRPSQDALVRSHLPLVDHLVREVASRVPSHVDRNELVSAAMYALALSARSFDPTLGTSFGSYASIRIRGALTDELRGMDWATRSVRSKARRIELARNDLAQSLGATPKAHQVAQAVGMSPAELRVHESNVARAELVSLQALTPHETDVAASSDEGNPESVALRREEFAQLREVVTRLPERLQQVITQYYFRQRKMSEIAAELGVTESRVSQLRSEALRWLRASMSATA
jgi:RNA polymerase sigma factor FliA